LLAAGGTALLAVAGYFLVYQVFLIHTPLSDLSREPVGGTEETFTYDGVEEFDGFGLRQGATRALEYAFPNAMNLSVGHELELFVRTTPRPGPGQSPGQLVVRQRGTAEPVALELTPDEQQRFVVPWDPTGDTGGNSFDITYLPPAGGQAPPDGAPRVLLSTDIRDVGLWPYVLLFGLGGAALLVAGVRSSSGPSPRLIAVVAASVGLMGFFHSGGLVSNVLFDGDHGRMGGQASQTLELLQTGAFRENIYRGAGFSAVPLGVAAIEGLDGLRSQFAQIFPTSRYVFFLWTAVALGFLLVSLYRNVHPGVALVTGLLYATFFPFAVDLYRPDSDANFIPLMTVLVAAFFYYVRSRRLLGTSGIVMALSLLLMLSVKITPAYLVLLVPLAVWADAIVHRRIWRQPRTLALLGAFVLAGVGGTALSSFGYPDDRNVGVAGVAFQDHVVWHILWAANGRYDKDNPFGFIKSGSARTEAVARVTGLPSEVGFIRQSQIATDQLYRPGFINMLKERPGFLLGTSMLRGFDRATYVYRYSGVPFEDLLQDGDAPARLIRQGDMWKVGGTFFLGLLVSKVAVLPVELLLLGAALFGIVALRRAAVVVLLGGSVLADLTFTTFIHVQDRYMMFNNVAILIGLAVFVVGLVRLAWAHTAVAGERLNRPHPGSARGAAS
jgi:hypothetical protein